jgi:TetR/AcrR family transcriptional repressor of nem operon
MTRAQKAGELSSTANPRDLARMLLTQTQGMALLGRVLEDEALLKSAVQATIALLKSA